MKVNYSVFKKVLVILSLFISSKEVFSQTVNVPYQFYLDANNNCTYDVGETYLYNLPGNMQLTYTNAVSSNITTTATAICGTSLAVTNPSVPATNSLTYINNYTAFIGTPTYPTFSYNPSCSAYSNLSYTTTNFLPVKSINQVSNLMVFVSPSVGYFYNGDSLNNTFPVCFNIGNDSVYFRIYADNIYTCNSTMASRTYSLYLDGILFDQITNSGLGYNTGIGTMGIIKETYSTNNIIYDFNITLPVGITALGNHTLSVQSSQLYNSSLSIFNYSCTLNSIPCSKVSGNFFTDCNSNCIKDPGDPPFGYAAFAQIYQTVGGFSVNAYPDANGEYSAYLMPSSNPYYLTSYSVTSSFTPCASTTYTIPGSASTNSIDFGYMTSNYYDVSVFCQPAGPSSVGGTMYFKLTYCLNNQITCLPLPVNPGKVKMLVPTNFTYTAPAFSTPSPNTVIPGPSGDTLVWNISDFNSMTGCIDYYVLVATSPTVTVGQDYCLNAFVNPLLDNVALNNQSTFCWYIGWPYDPNNKVSYAQGIQTNGDIPLTTTDLFYVINFQNIGTAPAIDVKTVDTLDINLDWTTLQILSGSDPVQSQIDYVSGQAIFYFKNIYLPDSTSDEPGSHGFVYYKIKLKTGLAANTIIKNGAHNYFDFQPPVPTNQTKNKLVNITAGINEMEKVNSVFIAPNPVSDKVTISSKELIQTILVLNNLGQVVMKQDVSNSQSQMDLSSLPGGIYFLNIHFKDGSHAIRKVIKN